MTSIDKTPPSLNVVGYLYQIPNLSPYATKLHPEAMYNWFGPHYQGMEGSILENSGVEVHPLCFVSEATSLLQRAVEEKDEAAREDAQVIEEIYQGLQEISNLVYFDRQDVTKKAMPGLVVALSNLLGTMKSKLPEVYTGILKELNVDVVTGSRHVDVWLDTPAWRMSEGEKAARFNMEIMRMPAWKAEAYKEQRSNVYCDYKGEQWQLAFASSMGWLGLCKPCESATPQYTETCLVSECENWSTELRDTRGK